MQILTQRSAALGACAALMVAACTTTQAAAALSTGASSAAGSSVIMNNGNDNDNDTITIIGNGNNAAGRDLLVGNNNTSGTGHTIGNPQAPQAFAQVWYITNQSSRAITMPSTSYCQGCAPLTGAGNPIPFEDFPLNVPPGTTVTIGTNFQSPGSESAQATFYDATGNPLLVSMQFIPNMITCQVNSVFNCTQTENYRMTVSDCAPGDECPS